MEFRALHVRVRLAAGKHLDVFNCHLQSTHTGTKGVTAIARHPPQSKLRSLFLWNNDINGAGLDALGEAIVRGRLKVDVLVVHTNDVARFYEVLVAVAEMPQMNQASMHWTSFEDRFQNPMSGGYSKGVRQSADP